MGCLWFGASVAAASAASAASATSDYGASSGDGASSSRVIIVVGAPRATTPCVASTSSIGAAFAFDAASGVELAQLQPTDDGARPHSEFGAAVGVHLYREKDADGDINKLGRALEGGGIRALDSAGDRMLAAVLIGAPGVANNQGGLYRVNVALPPGAGAALGAATAGSSAGSSATPIPPLLNATRWGFADFSGPRFGRTIAVGRGFRVASSDSAGAGTREGTREGLALVASQPTAGSASIRLLRLPSGDIERSLHSPDALVSVADFGSSLGISSDGVAVIGSSGAPHRLLHTPLLTRSATLFTIHFIIALSHALHRIIPVDPHTLHRAPG